MTIKEEFEKAYDLEWGAKGTHVLINEALWAARWMAERCAIFAEEPLQVSKEEAKGIIDINRGIAKKIRQLAKELEHD